MLARIAISLLLVAASSAAVFAHDGEDHGAQSGQDHHQIVNLAGDSAPRIVELKVEKDPVAGFNLFVVTENFDFAPELVNTPHVDGKGHGHIYVDGVKVARIYGPAFHLDGLDKGRRRIEVTLNANDHKQYAANGARISAETSVEVP
jgi:Nucleoside-binding outer membrane protein